jgi:hypothetical protein
MEQWEYMAEQLTDTGLLSEAGAEVHIRRDFFGELNKAVAERRGTNQSAASKAYTSGKEDIAELRKGLRLYDIYINDSSDVRPGDTLWLLPDSWTETAHQYVLDGEMGVAVMRLPDGSFAKVRRRLIGPTEEQHYTVEAVGEEYRVSPVEIDWAAFNDNFPVGTTSVFREYVEERYRQLVQNAVGRWLSESADGIGEADLFQEPHALEVTDSLLVEHILGWSEVPMPGDDVSLEDMDQEHPGHTVNHALRYVESKGFDDAIHSFPNVFHDALDKSTDGRYLLGFNADLVGGPEPEPTPEG